MRGDNREYPDGQQVKELMVIVGTERSGVSTEDDREAGNEELDHAEWVQG